MQMKTKRIYLALERGTIVSNTFIRVNDVAAELGVSKSYAYKIVQKLNAELKGMGYLTVAGRINKRCFMEKACCGRQEKTEGK